MSHGEQVQTMFAKELSPQLRTKHIMNKIYNNSDCKFKEFELCKFVTVMLNSAPVSGILRESYCNVLNILSLSFWIQIRILLCAKLFSSNSRNAVISSILTQISFLYTTSLSNDCSFSAPVHNKIPLKVVCVFSSSILVKHCNQVLTYNAPLKCSSQGSQRSPHYKTLSSICNYHFIFLLAAFNLVDPHSSLDILLSWVCSLPI